MIDVKIVNEPLDIPACMAKATDAECGGMNVFAGHVRDQTKGRKVLRLEFECYQSMALKELNNIAEDASLLWPVKAIVIHHRIGTLQVGEAAVVVVVNSMHREAAFKACQYAIDTLKQRVPIWKKEVFEDGEEWVSAHP